MTECEDRPSNAALDGALCILGDRWTLLVLYEISTGTCRFNHIQRHTGMPRDRLALRLRRLEARAVICRRQYCRHPPRFEYGLTEAGRSLAPTLKALETWGARYSLTNDAGRAASSLRNPCCTHPGESVSGVPGGVAAVTSNPP